MKMQTTRKALLGVLLPLFSQMISAQNFTEVLGTPFVGTMYSSTAFADIDGDSDQDVLISGQDDNLGRITKLYTNDGSGNFTEVLNTPFEGISEGSLAFADVDGDLDQDVLITGLGASGSIAKLYINDGLGNFSQDMSASFDGVHLSSIAFADVDNDNDQDVLITGMNSSFAYVSKLYTNDGSSNFSEVMNSSMDGVRESSVAFADVDGDGDLDLMISGAGFGSIGIITKLYTNDGTGNFTEMTGTPFVNVAAGSVAFADVDGDNDQDVLITGVDLAGTRLSKLYTNDGSGSFSEVLNTPFVGVYDSSVDFADIDGDNDQDVLITGASMFAMHSILYLNDGLGVFTEMMETPFDPMNIGSIAFSDVDGDSDQDVLLTGQNNAITTHISKLYLNESFLSSTEVIQDGSSLNLTPYPNPAESNHINLRFASLESNQVLIGVYGMNGSLISQQNAFVGIGEQNLGVDIAHLSSGTYFIQLEHGDRVETTRFTVP